MKVLVFSGACCAIGMVAATPGAFNDLGESKDYADSYWNTSNRVETVVDVAESISSEIAVDWLVQWDVSNTYTIWSTPLTGLFLLLH